MDEVLDKFVKTAIGEDPKKTYFSDLYKNWGKLGSQEERRKEILEVQKWNRSRELDSVRGILNLVDTTDDNELFGQTHKTYYRPNIYVAGFNKVSSAYRNVLMMSEWMVEKPEDFHEDWYLVPCPKGVRMLVIASQGTTKCYTKYGQFRYEKSTALPGGNHCDPKQRNQCCVLDCFYVDKLNTMFVLDILAWNNQPMTDGETEFRQYWLQTYVWEKMQKELTVLTRRNRFLFKLLPKVNCDIESLNKFLSSHPAFEEGVPQLDGLLFYHKKGHYFAGQTPLVGWLYPYMVPELISPDVTLHETYKSEKPTDYVNQLDYIEKFEAKETERKTQSRPASVNAMDTADETKPEALSKEHMEAEDIQTTKTNDLGAEILPNETSEDVK